MIEAGVRETVGKLDYIESDGPLQEVAFTLKEMRNQGWVFEQK